MNPEELSALKRYVLWVLTTTAITACFIGIGWFLYVYIESMYDNSESRYDYSAVWDEQETLNPWDPGYKST